MYKQLLTLSFIGLLACEGNNTNISKTKAQIAPKQPIVMPPTIIEEEAPVRPNPLDFFVAESPLDCLSLYYEGGNELDRVGHSCYLRKDEHTLYHFNCRQNQCAVDELSGGHIAGKVFFTRKNDPLRIFRLTRRGNELTLTKRWSNVAEVFVINPNYIYYSLKCWADCMQEMTEEWSAPMPVDENNKTSKPDPEDSLPS